MMIPYASSTKLILRKFSTTAGMGGNVVVVVHDLIDLSGRPTRVDWRFQFVPDPEPQNVLEQINARLGL